MDYSNKQIEKIILGCILQKGDLYESLIGIVDDKDFTNTLYRKLYKLFGLFFKKDIKIDIATISDYAYKKRDINNWIYANDLGISTLMEIQHSVPNIEMISQYVKILKNDTYNRNILEATEKYRTGKLTAEKLTETIENTKPPEEVKKETNEDIILKTLEDAEQGTDFKFPDNFEGLNDITGGFDRGDLIIIGGYPSNGKSSMCTELTVGFCNIELNILVITLEMSTKANMRRILANTQKINTMKFRQGNLSDLDKEKIRSMIPVMNDIWKYNCVRAYSMPDIIRAVKEYKPDIVIIDYLQNISDSENLSEYARLTKFTLQIQQMAKAKNTATFLLSQFHRPQEGKIRKPRNNDFRGSGSIEERAEIILLIYWERKLKLESLSRSGDENPEYVIIDVTKNKDGETGEVEQKVLPECHRWYNMDDDRIGEVIKYENAVVKSKEDNKKRYERS